MRLTQEVCQESFPPVILWEGGCQGHGASWSRPLGLVHTHSGTLAGLEERKCQLHVFQALPASQETPLRSDTSSEPCRRAGLVAWAGLRRGPVTQGSVRRRQDVSAIHWATRNLSAIYRQRNCWPSLAGKRQPLPRGCGGEWE